MGASEVLCTSIGLVLYNQVTSNLFMDFVMVFSYYDIVDEVRIEDPDPTKPKELFDPKVFGLLFVAYVVRLVITYFYSCGVVKDWTEDKDESSKNKGIFSRKFLRHGSLLSDWLYIYYISTIFLDTVGYSSYFGRVIKLISIVLLLVFGTINLLWIIVFIGKCCEESNETKGNNQNENNSNNGEIQKTTCCQKIEYVIVLIIRLGPSQLIPAISNYYFWEYYSQYSGSKVEISAEDAKSIKWIVRVILGVVCFREFLTSIRLATERGCCGGCCQKKSKKYKPRRRAAAAPPEIENQRLSQGGVVISQPDEGTEEVEVETKDEKIRVMTKRLGRVSKILEGLFMLLEFFVLGGYDFLNDYALYSGFFKSFVVYFILSQHIGFLWCYKKKKIDENK